MQKIDGHASNSDKPTAPRIVHKTQQIAIGLVEALKQENVHQGISQLWDKFEKRMSEIKDTKPGIAMGICLPFHPDVIRKTDNDFIYAAALPVHSVAVVPPGMQVFTIPAGDYAVFTHKGSLDTLQETLQFIWGEWIPQNHDGYKHAIGPDFEYYDDRFDKVTRSGAFDICVPVSK